MEERPTSVGDSGKEFVACSVKQLGTRTTTPKPYTQKQAANTQHRLTAIGFACFNDLAIVPTLSHQEMLNLIEVM